MGAAYSQKSPWTLGRTFIIRLVEFASPVEALHGLRLCQGLAGLIGSTRVSRAGFGVPPDPMSILKPEGRAFSRAED